MTTTAPRDNLRGGAWLVADMALNIWALSIVKALGLGYPAEQLVFLRAIVGLIILLPFLWHGRAIFGAVPALPYQILRVVLSTATLTASYYAISRVPLALFTTMNFTRPLVVMLLAALVLREHITRPQWAAAALAMLGVVIAIEPTGATFGTGLLALCLVIFLGSSAVIVTRYLRATPVLVLMTFYTAGLILLSAPFALTKWQSIQPDHLWPLLAIGVFAQAAQACFLRAHFHGEAGVLAVLGYLSLPLSVAAGILLFDETPTLRFGLGAALVITAAASLSLFRNSRNA